MRKKFLQSDSRLSDVSKSMLTNTSKSRHSNRNSERFGRSSSLMNKSNESVESDEAVLYSNRSTRGKKMNLIHETSFSDDEVVTRKPFNDRSNQMEKSRRDNQDRTELMTANLMTIENNSFDLAPTKQLNSTAILSATLIKNAKGNKKTLTFTPIPSQKNTHKQLVDKTIAVSYEDADSMFEKETQHAAVKTSMSKPKHSLTVNSSQHFESANKKSNQKNQ